MSNLKKQLEELNHTVELIDFARTVAKDKTIFKTGLNAKSNVKDEVRSAVKSFLTEYANSLEHGVNITSVLSLTKEELETIKLFVDRVKNQPALKESRTGKPKVDSTAQQSKAASVGGSADLGIPKFAHIVDTTYVTEKYGSNAPVATDDKIKVLREVDSDTVEAHLINNPSMVFQIPKDCIYV